MIIDSGEFFIGGVGEIVAVFLEEGLTVFGKVVFHDFMLLVFVCGCGVSLAVKKIDDGVNVSSGSSGLHADIASKLL